MDSIQLCKDIKVSQFRNVFLVSSIFQKKNEQKQFDLRYHSNFSGRFLGELKIRKRHFEINRPLVSKAACNLVHFHMHTFYSIGRSRLKIEIAFGWNYFQGCWNVWDMGKLSPPSYNRIFTFYCHSSSKIVSLKVRWFRNNFWYPRILPKNERTNSFFFA